MRETTTIKVDPELWREFRKYAIDKRTTASDLIEQFIRLKLNKPNKKSEQLPR